MQAVLCRENKMCILETPSRVNSRPADVIISLTIITAGSARNWTEKSCHARVPGKVTRSSDMWTCTYHRIHIRASCKKINRKINPQF